MIEIYLLEQLEAFARCGTLSAAAEELHLSQPALTRSMKKLEELIGVPIFERGKNKLTSTADLFVKNAGLKNRWSKNVLNAQTRFLNRAAAGLKK